MYNTSFANDMLYFEQSMATRRTAKSKLSRITILEIGAVLSILALITGLLAIVLAS